MGPILSSMGAGLVSSLTKSARRLGAVVYTREDAGPKPPTYLGPPDVETGEESPWRVVEDYGREPMAV